ncbi:MAG TPA: SIS domain-containing protein [Planctomycetota bacterium]|nr:SIS domain-containing protein [Planctomycetota bacterium]
MNGTIQCQACGKKEAVYVIVEVGSAGVEFRCCADCWKKAKALLHNNGTDVHEQLVACLRKSAPRVTDGESKSIREHMIDTISAKIKMMSSPEFIDKIREISDVLVMCLRHDGKIFTCGCGACAGEAQHLVNELVGRCKLAARRGFPAVCLGSNPALLDDFAFEDVFVRQVEALVSEHDVLMGISGTGCSTAVVRALRRASEQGAFTIGLCGGDGGDVLDSARLALVVPSNEPQTVQECQTTAVHILCDLIEQALCSDGDSSEPVLA